MKFEITPIAYAKSCFKEKFATPRQPGLVSLAQGQIKMQAPYNHPDTVDGLLDCSHLWLQFIFHQCIEQGWKNKVRPPRLGGNKKMGVFATRATHRPNALGLSVVKLDNITFENNELTLHVSGLDLIDGTPIVDIKPYIPYSDSLPNAQYPFAQLAPKMLSVNFSESAQQTIYNQQHKPHLTQFIQQVLSQDPRPAFHEVDETRIYGAKLEEFDVSWVYKKNNEEVYIEVRAIKFL
jgi:tRNA-Thr(GGU) m(6)t(6)A37 methyltransferase TsaA